MEAKKLVRKPYEGIVVSTKMDKVAVVLMERFIVHPLYKKRVKRSKKLFVHDEGNICKDGDKIRFINSRPYSKNTKFRLVEVLVTGSKS